MNYEQETRSVLLIDMKGNAAIVPSSEIHRFWTKRVLRHAAGGLVVETGEVLKDCDQLRKYQSLRSRGVVPEAKPIWGYLKRSKELHGDKAIRFKLGYNAENGFSIPLSATLDVLYDVDKSAGP